jgi:hypothetical protein
MQNLPTNTLQPAGGVPALLPYRPTASMRRTLQEAIPMPMLRDQDFRPRRPQKRAPITLKIESETFCEPATGCNLGACFLSASGEAQQPQFNQREGGAYNDYTT